MRTRSSTKSTYSHLDGEDFQTRDDIKSALEQFSKGQSPAFWSRGIHDLPNRKSGQKLESLADSEANKRRAVITY
ncbi:hypothetical protein ANCDUO_09315 [Ancylostoma duodenale]|uniref:Uncharacterized protein n=1 Tax=Ancylostoma duodenale TaxID=51022 RepID=A0A0C2DDD1_9BILA|nr:hypothetical protein ANCDUO_09315 [Ancylostoma duodenale]